MEAYACPAGCESARVSRASRIETIRSGRGIGIEFQGDAVDAVAQPGGGRATFEDVTQMSAAAPAMHLRAWQQQDAVGGGADRVRQRTIEARPPGTAVVFGIGREQRKIAAGADEHALALLVIERARTRDLRAVQAQHVILRLGQHGSPFAVALLQLATTRR